MFDGLVRIVDRLIELRKYREERNLRLFNSTVGKIYEGMREIHADYLAMFKSCENALSRNTPLREIGEAIATARLLYEPTRVQITAMLWELIKHPELQTHKEMLTGLLSYFHCVDILTAPGTPASALLKLVEAAESKSLRGIETTLNDTQQESVRKTVSLGIDQLKQHWQELSQLYAKEYSKAL